MPLHAASRWIEDISANLAHIPPDARVVLSDVTGVDDALARLERIHDRDSRLHFRRENAPAGWRLHINALLGEVDSELFAVLPQDDRICAGYYQRLVAALERTPTDERKMLYFLMQLLITPNEIYSSLFLYSFRY